MAIICGPMRKFLIVGRIQGVSTRYRFCGIQAKPHGDICIISRRMIISLFQHMLKSADLLTNQYGNGQEDSLKILRNSLEWPKYLLLKPKSRSISKNMMCNYQRTMPSILNYISILGILCGKMRRKIFGKIKDIKTFKSTKGNSD